MWIRDGFTSVSAKVIRTIGDGTLCRRDWQTIAPFSPFSGTQIHRTIIRVYGKCLPCGKKKCWLCFRILKRANAKSSLTHHKIACTFPSFLLVRRLHFLLSPCSSLFISVYAGCMTSLEWWMHLVSNLDSSALRSQNLCLAHSLLTPFRKLGMKTHTQLPWARSVWCSVCELET